MNRDAKATVEVAEIEDALRDEGLDPDTWLDSFNPGKIEYEMLLGAQDYIDQIIYDIKQEIAHG